MDVQQMRCWMHELPSAPPELLTHSSPPTLGLYDDLGHAIRGDAATALLDFWLLFARRVVRVRRVVPTLVAVVDC
jgi:hypothetical protein